MKNTASEKFLETSLYKPVSNYLKENGYGVSAEVDHCDIVAKKDDELVVIELKRGITLDLLIQATDRQKITSSVYVAIPAPKKMGRGKKWKGTIRLLRLLELGLIVVYLNGKKSRVEIKLHPLPYDRKKQSSRKRSVLKEIAGRTFDLNKGGCTREKIVTAYRENAIQIACLLELLGETSPKDLRKKGTGPKTLSILYNNFYGWFDRVDKGLYTLSNKGLSEIKNYPTLLEHYKATIPDRA